MSVVRPEIKQLIKDSVDAEMLLKALGFQISRSTGYEVRAPCKLHGGDNPTGFSIKTDTKTWKCFTHHCDEDASGKAKNDVFALVMKALGVGFMDAVRFLAELAGLSYDDEAMMAAPTEESRRLQDTTNYIRSVSRVRQRASHQSGPSEDDVAAYQLDVDDYFVQQGFAPETLVAFEIGSKVDEEGVRRATVPIRSADGTLVSISGRRVDGDAEPRYKLDFQFQKGRVLYNLHRALQTGADTIIIVEGFKALWSVYEAGFPNVVACMGSAITDEQVLTLCSSGFRNAIVMFDGDDAGRKGISSAVKKLSSAFNTQPIYLPDKTSPDDLPRIELKELIELHLQTL